MKKFENVAAKVNAIKNVFREGEKLRGKEIVQRLEESGYKVNERNILMFIYHRMLHKHVRREMADGINLYTLL
ncbi:MAG: hypothetical protein D6733_07095 [Methanobacteriota archaeon]|nr:MAG: hypothetical protein D6733_07095 [Euryarchaeota archaeon]